MNRTRPSLRMAAVIAALAGAILWAGQQKPPEPVAEQTETIFTADTRLVSLNVSVVDKNGHLVRGLPESAFTVLENGAIQKIKDFRSEDVPVSLGLIIDNSGSMRQKRQSVESAALALVRDSNPDDEEFVVNFNDAAYLDAPIDGSGFTNDIRALEQGLTKIDSRGGTAMRDAIRMSIDHLNKKGKRDKKVVLVVTDGNDNASDPAFGPLALVRQSQQSDVLVFAIGLLSDEEKSEANAAKHVLNLLTEATGGLAFYPRNVLEVEKIAHEVAHDIRNQYTITYTPSNQALDGSFRSIRVAVNAAGKPAARTRLGYYASKDVRR